MDKTVAARAVSVRLGHVTTKMADVIVVAQLVIKEQLVMTVIAFDCFIVIIYVDVPLVCRSYLHLHIPDLYPVHLQL